MKTKLPALVGAFARTQGLACSPLVLWRARLPVGAFARMRSGGCTPNPRALASTPTAGGFALLEIILAMALFSIVAVGMTRALDQIAQTTKSSRQEAQVLRVLESVLAEVAHQPELKPRTISFPKTSDGIDASASIEKVRLFTQDKAELDKMFRIRAEAWLADGASKRQLKRQMETYVYSPASP